jgi:hypothetical protein
MRCSLLLYLFAPILFDLWRQGEGRWIKADDFQFPRRNQGR